LAKGHVEEGETELDTARREVQEETGLKNLRFARGFRETIRYYFRAEGQTVFKTVAFYAAEAKTDKVIISHEHAGFVWLPCNTALKHLKFQNAKDVVSKAHHFLSKRSVSGRKKNPKRRSKDV